VRTLLHLLWRHTYLSVYFSPGFDVGGGYRDGQRNPEQRWSASADPAPGDARPSPAGSGSAWLNAIGDIGWCGSQAMPQVARLLDNLPGDILLAGDIAYMNGTADEFAAASIRTSAASGTACGPHRAITTTERPTPTAISATSGLALAPTAGASTRSGPGPGRS